jgi:uncharacterized protein YndB with AHSA1/START domain
VAHPFEVQDEITVDASPEDVWQAISSGPHLNSWFIGHSEIEPGPNGKVRMDLGGFVSESAITAWEPGKHLAYRSAEGPDGAWMSFEYVIEARGGGRTSIRLVHSGFLAGDDWETEYDALKRGDPMYLHLLGQYVTYFRGRLAARSIFAVGPNVTDRQRVRSVLREQLGLSDGVAEGARVGATLDGLGRVDGVVDYVKDEFLGVRTEQGLIRLIHGYDGSVIAEYHIFDPGTAQQQTSEDWQKWLTAVLD